MNDRSREAIERERREREAGLDDTLAQTFPASDPLSSIPNPLPPQDEQA